ncbi:MAG TPA: hypothetical protein VLG27_03360 [Candidatus Saccharimonadia bacterium]|nr:hypothetical protein [Candidatus Saccharimonadia bacterium]
MIKIGGFGRVSARTLCFFAAAVVLLAFLAVYRLGSLVGGLSAGELQAGIAPVGWHGIYHSPIYLPLKLVRSVFFFVFPAHGQTITRLPNVVFGVLSVVAFTALIWLWHSRRTAILTGLLFATGAWTLHASRLASFDVMYLWAMPTLLLINALLYRHYERADAWYGSLLVMGLMLYIPGMVWLLLLNAFFLRVKLWEGWKSHGLWWQRSLSVLAVLIWLPLLIVDLLRHGQLVQWLGLPVHLAGPAQLLKHLVAVPVHLLVRGPQYPDIWLGKSPVLDIFTLVACLIGIYFYASHLKAGRSQLLAAFAVAGWLLVALAGPVGLSLLVPLLYVAAATGIAYLLHEWLKVFPRNPLARGLGIGLICVVVAAACVYNLRDYFVAFPNDRTTRATFQYYLRR